MPRYRRATHLRYKGRTWSCATVWLDEFGVVQVRLGVGYTVRQAIEEWRKQG